MTDSHGRKIEYLRLSLTERCNLKCVYCRTGEYEQCTAKYELTLEEIRRIMACMTRLGVNKVRLTGGEPLVRRDLEQVVETVAQSGDIQDLCMTTNAQLLANRAKGLKKAGLMRLNISLDSLKPERYSAITRGGTITDVLKGIDAAIESDLLPVKINVVTVRGSNDDEIDDLIALAKDRPIDVRFIELMPIGEYGRDANKRIPSDELIAARPELIPVKPHYPGQPSADYTLPGYKGRIGFISPISHKFCNLCNRVRITSDARLKPCLGRNAEVNLRDAMIGDKEALFALIRETIWNKPEGHNFDKMFDSERTMNRIGG